MTMEELLEKDREFLHSQLLAEPSAEQAAQTASKELDRILYDYLEQCESDALRNLASSLVETAKASLGLLRAYGEPRIWEAVTPGDTAGGKNTGKSHLKLSADKAAPWLCGIGALLILFAYLWIILPESGRQNAWTGILFVLGAAVLFTGARLLHVPKQNRKEQKAEVTADPEKVYACLHTMTVVMDHSLEKEVSRQNWDKASQVREEASRVSREEAELYAGLLEALYARDASFALESLENLKYYLHQKKIEIVDYAPEHKDLFDFIPGESKGTIRPALTMGGKVLARGLASV